MADKFVVEFEMNAQGIATSTKRASGEIRNVGTAATVSTAKVGLLKRALHALKANAIVAGIAAIYGAFRLLGKSVEAAGIQQIAERRLEQALRNLGRGADDSAERLKRHAAELQKNSNFGDELIISAQSVLLSFQEAAGPEGVELLSQGIVDLAAFSEKTGQELGDLNSIALLMGRALSTGSGALKKVGISLTDTQQAAFDAAEGMDRVRILQEVIEANAGGMAAATVQPMRQLRNAVGDLQEELGDDLKIGLDAIAGSFTQIAQSEGAGTVVRFVGRQIATVFRGIAVALDIPRTVVRFFQTDLKEAAASVQEFVATASRKLASFYTAAALTFARLPGLGSAIAETYITAAGAMRRFADAAEGVATRNRNAAEETRKTIAAEKEAEAVRGAGAEAALALASAIEDETDANTAATKAAEAYVGVVRRMTDALIKLRQEKDDLREADFFELVRLNQQTAALERQIASRNRLLQAVAGIEAIGARGLASVGTQAGDDPAAGIGIEDLDMSGTQTELQRTEEGVRSLGESFENLETITGNFARASSIAFGENAAAFKAIALAETIIATARAVAQALPNVPLAASVGALGAAQVAKILSTSIPGGGGGGSAPRGVSPLTAGITTGGGRSASPVNVQSHVHITDETRIVAVDGFAIQKKVRAAEQIQRDALGR